MMSENKIKHSLGVARACKQIAISHNRKEEAMNYFIMGLLHDIGYENGEALGHSLRGYEALLSFGCLDNKYLEAIKNHGTYFSDIKNVTFEWATLVLADLTTDYDCSPIDSDKRLKSIKERYGEDSKQYKTAVKQLEIIHQYMLSEEHKENYMPFPLH